jgi:hypothetical protein
MRLPGWLRIIELALLNPRKTDWLVTGSTLLCSGGLVIETVVVAHFRLTGFDIVFLLIGATIFSGTLVDLAVRRKDPLHDAAQEAIQELRKDLQSMSQLTCGVCGTKGLHSAEECFARRPGCHVLDCPNKSCVQALNNGRKPTCLHHFFGGVDGIKTRYERLLDDTGPE